MCYRFEFIDIILFYKILHGLVQISFPPYLHFYSNQSRLRFCHLDSHSLVCDIIPNTTTSQDRTTNAFANSFFYRTHLLWNKLPINIRSIHSFFWIFSSFVKYLFQIFVFICVFRELRQLPSPHSAIIILCRSDDVNEKTFCMINQSDSQIYFTKINSTIG